MLFWDTERIKPARDKSPYGACDIDVQACMWSAFGQLGIFLMDTSRTSSHVLRMLTVAGAAARPPG